MLAPALGLLGVLWVSSTVGVHAERIRGLDEPRTEELLRVIQRRLEDNGHRVVIDRRPPSLLGDRAAVDLSQNLQVEELLVFSAFAGPTTLRVTGERFGITGKRLGRIDRDDPIDRWSEGVGELVTTLFPRLRTSSAAGSATGEAVKTEASPLPWILVGTGVVASGLGLGFAIHGASIRGEVGSERNYSVEGAGMLDTASIFSTLATSMIVGGLLMAGTGLAFASAEP